MCSSFLGRSLRGATRQELGLWGAGPCEFPAFNHQPTRSGTAGRVPPSQGGCSPGPPGTLSAAVLAPSPPSGPVAGARSCPPSLLPGRGGSALSQASRTASRRPPEELSKRARPWQPEPACPPAQGDRVGPTRLLEAEASAAGLEGQARLGSEASSLRKQPVLEVQTYSRNYLNSQDMDTMSINR